MTAISAEHVAIAELVVYIPTALLTIFVIVRHGLHKPMGWIYLFIFSALRIVGAVFAILSHNNPDNATYIEWAAILQSVGLSPLVLSSLSLLKRVLDETATRFPKAARSMTMQDFGVSSGIAGKLSGIYSKRATATPRRGRVAQLLHLPVIIAVGLAISGGIDNASSDVSQHAGGKTKTRVAITLFLAIYAVLCLLWAITLRDLSSMVSSQKRIYAAVFFALPLIAVRLLYSLISDFGHDSRFSIVDGDALIQLFMATIEEFIVVFMYTVIGVITPRWNVAADSGSKPVSYEPANSGTQSLLPGEYVAPSSQYHTGYNGYSQIPYAEAEVNQAHHQRYGQ